MLDESAGKSKGGAVCPTSTAEAPELINRMVEKKRVQITPVRLLSGVIFFVVEVLFVSVFGHYLSLLGKTFKVQTIYYFYA